MSGFTKLFSEIVTSSIWDETDSTRIVWITMLALAGPDGIVRAALPGLANAARVSREDCQRAIDRFEAPDPFSRSRDNDGRRIERVDGGYLLLNYQKYRAERDKEHRREYQRQWAKDKRKASAVYRGRERRYVRAVENGNQTAADNIASEGLGQ